VALVCKTLQDRIEESFEQPIIDWEKRQEQRCRDADCDWWTLCLNKLFCWLVDIFVKIVRFILVTVVRYIIRIVCEVVSYALDLVAVFVNMILAIPIIGGIIRTILNWVTEAVNRAVGLVDFGLGLIGVRPEKLIYVGVMIPSTGGQPITTEATMMPMITAAQTLYKKYCNVRIVYTGACAANPGAPDNALTISCDAQGFFADWWSGGSWIEFASARCKYEDGWRRVVGWGAQIIVLPILNVTPDTATQSTVGCSFAATHDYVVVEPGASANTAAHEIGHACLLTHGDDSGNLMWAGTIAANPSISSWQAAVIRWSRHCVYF
jgi:hypothetical protein